MLRVIVGALAAFVGFSIGHSFPKWFEGKYNSAPVVLNPSSCQLEQPIRKHASRRRLLRKLRLGSFKHGKYFESKRPVEKLSNQSRCCDVYAQSNSSAGKGVQCSRSTCEFTSELERLFENQTTVESSSPKIVDDRLRNQSLHAELGSSETLRMFEETPHYLDRSSKESFASSSPSRAATTFGHGEWRETRQVARVDSRLPCLSPQWETRARKGAQETGMPMQSTVLKDSSLEDEHGHSTLVKQKSQMAQWKMKLIDLRSKAMDSEKVWFQKFNSTSCRRLSVDLSLRNPPSDKSIENETWNRPFTEKEFSWSRSASVGLLGNGSKSALER
ncbi:hypothetical protein KP509_20G021700 [Ceratopteris richardii]|uniref:Uncharacterized protein n=1 Tax=Ceratopteris richardii TaxID=49495 RepID=A0A8T2SFK7_CERRI|nr:hypothetical protein KP509_20G021700 [Ceratopteris richardii]